jgi:hypothetical protein
MFCAIASWMLYSIRKHRLDDFTATYRVWLVMLGVSVFSSFDASTSALYLLGQSIDPWTKKEMGYGGWPLVLAVYASVVALVGLRLTGELRAVPGAVALWFGGLIAWGCAALLGTGLLKLQWSLGSIDLFVGACWLGGVLAVFQSVGLTLRYCYMQAQYRFIERIAFTKASNTQWSKSVEDEPEDSKEIDLKQKTLMEQKAALAQKAKISKAYKLSEVTKPLSKNAIENLLSSSFERILSHEGYAKFSICIILF